MYVKIIKYLQPSTLLYLKLVLKSLVCDLALKFMAIIAYSPYPTINCKFIFIFILGSEGRR